MADPGGLYSTLANCHPSLTRGQVWCHTCGHTQRVDSAQSFRSGWPMHCGETMSIDSPDERRALGGVSNV
jgi:hypothetical protein